MYIFPHMPTSKFSLQGLYAFIWHSTFTGRSIKKLCHNSSSLIYSIPHWREGGENNDDIDYRPIIKSVTWTMHIVQSECRLGALITKHKLKNEWIILGKKALTEHWCLVWLLRLVRKSNQLSIQAVQKKNYLLENLTSFITVSCMDAHSLVF